MPATKPCRSNSNRPAANFSTDGLCLRYDTDRPDDIAKLKQLEFEAVELDKQTIYTRCVSAKGKYYATPQKLNADYHFEQSVPVEIYYMVKGEYTDKLKLFGNILYTPPLLILDAAGAVLALPTAARVRSWMPPANEQQCRLKSFQTAF